MHPGVNTGRGGDDTLFALIDGVVKYETLKMVRNKYLFILLQNSIC